ncbi:Benzene 1,2-dioxygenase system ferredoxin--NAD(+) reductase subunit [Micromonospora sp. MW-13]|uniref:FAD-dependent oxidoreductase n=1 Tax=Micromonospora sp. MW-13 TaxID=2094022 RepID=UPI000E43BE6B|nr:NAD(P)/FAD-dependent oxidoreductase [Micromonospora sp. MW-13]RGC65360.1 Benzene 1,2-dioxygenase system ferredoxin--NAD(+) reductase subunit [Micromonospora sp. MW-13]
MAIRVVVVGGGAAGGACARALAATAETDGYVLDVTVVSVEARRPYNRTTVNKGLLSGAAGEHEITLAELDHPDIRWLLDVAAVGLDAHSRTVTLSTGRELAADAVVIATGAQPRGLDADIDPAAAHRVLPLRTPAHTARLRQLAAAGPVVVAGAGLIGSEVPASLQQLGCAVTLVDPADHPLSGHVGPLVGTWAADTLTAQGVVLHMGATVAAVRAPGGQRQPLTVTLSDGTVLPAAAVVSAVGARLDTDWLAGSGIAEHPSAAGLLVDGEQRVVGHSGLYAAGDLAARPGATSPIRLEHWGEALRQGRRAARTVLTDLNLYGGEPDDAASTAEVVSFSTYLGPIKLTMLGSPGRDRAEHVVFGAPDQQRFLVAYTLDEAVVGAVGVGGARAANRIKPLVARGADLDDVRGVLRALAG